MPIANSLPRMFLLLSKGAFSKFCCFCKEQSVTLLTYEEGEEDFKFLVESMNQKNTNIRKRYAKQFGCINQTGNTQSLLQLSTKASCHEITYLSI
jgi:hypothetical protein